MGSEIADKKGVQHLQKPNSTLTVHLLLPLIRPMSPRPHTAPHHRLKTDLTTQRLSDVGISRHLPVVATLPLSPASGKYRHPHILLRPYPLGNPHLRSMGTQRSMGTPHPHLGSCFLIPNQEDHRVQAKQRKSVG